jgi:hypothetical protein
MAVLGGRTGQWAFEFLATDKTQMKHGFSEARQGWHICSNVKPKWTKLRQERHHRDGDGRCRPDGAENGFGFRFYKYAAPDGAGDGATPKTATGTGALPGKVPVGGRAPAPANGSLGWTNGAMGV